MRRALRIRRPSASAVAATVVLLFVLSFVLLTISVGGGGGGGGGGLEDVIVSAQRMRAIDQGTTRADVERRLGKGLEALAYEDTGIAVEPMDASCIYYRARQDSFNDVAQFCFRDDRLVSRRLFIAPRS
jgi:hypothetical protein